MSRLPVTIALVLALSLAALGCGTSKDETGSTTASAADCTPAQLDTHTKGELTVATDEPAYEPYFVNDEPDNGKGFESAVAFAIGKRLGFDKSEVKWTVEPFNSSYAPGPKDFDFDVNQISITPQREKAVDFSAPYYTANQAIVAAHGSDAAKATNLAGLKDAKIGVQIGTTSQEAVEDKIDPSTEIQVFNSSNDVVTALKNGQVEAVAVDVPTALYVTAVQAPSASIVGQFPAPGGDQWGALLAKGSSLTACVSNAIEAMRSSGELQQLTQQWMSKAAGAPELG
jgi:polar amino acid transport system substrate-binding protein